ncbi:MAG: chromosomal replication initiator protein DnaA [Deferribacteraceae bacterium]|jgi:chromosomal replication initiator protein|nr:chromosomal replication initiator protein DnaA [Deferribacteraceae bacterium]
MYDQNLWDGILESISKTEDKTLVNTWLRPAKISADRGDVVTIFVKNKFFKDWIEKSYLAKIKMILATEFGIDTNVRVVAENIAPAATKPIKSEETPAVSEPLKSFEAKYTFDNFVNGDSNGFAHSAALAVADGNFSVYNPLYIYGSTGLGKTHLMYAIANRVREKFPKMTILCMDSETFTKEVLNTFRKGDYDNMQERVEKLRERFRVDLFMLDDIQFLKGREKTLETFFNIFNDLHLRQKQMVITSDKSPQEINMEERMRSRFASGFQTEIQPPSSEERAAILMQKAEEFKIPLDDEMAFYLAENVAATNIRELEGALNRVNIYASFNKVKITPELAEKALSDSGQLKRSKLIVSPQQLISAVAELYNVKLSDLTSKKRTQSVVRPRQVAMYLMKERLNLSLKEIGSHFGGRDHSTVKYAVDSIKEQIKDDEYLAGIVEKIVKRAF